MCASIRCSTLMEDGPDREVVLEVLERLFDLGELHVVAPERGGVFVGHVRAQQIAALAAAYTWRSRSRRRRTVKLWACQLLVGVRARDVDQAPGPAGVLLGGAELEQQLIPGIGLPLQLAEPLPQGSSAAAGACRVPSAAAGHSAPGCKSSPPRQELDCRPIGRTACQGCARNACLQPRQAALGGAHQVAHGRVAGAHGRQGLLRWGCRGP